MGGIGNKRFCYYIAENVTSPDGRGFIPCLVIEGEKGYRPMTGQGESAQPWVWGPSFENACEAADVANERLGLTQADVNAIIVSSIMADRV